MPLKINGKTILLYACCGAAMVFANCAVKGVPLSFGIFFAMMLCGMNLIAAPILFALSSIVNLNLLSSLIFIFAAISSVTDISLQFSMVYTWSQNCSISS